MLKLHLNYYYGWPNNKSENHNYYWDCDSSRCIIEPFERFEYLKSDGVYIFGMAVFQITTRRFFQKKTRRLAVYSCCTSVQVFDWAVSGFCVKSGGFSFLVGGFKKKLCMSCLNTLLMPDMNSTLNFTLKSMFWWLPTGEKVVWGEW